MGQGVMYCDGCGEQVLELDLRAGKAIALAARTFCPECVAKSAVKPPPARPASRPPRTPFPAGTAAGGSPAKPFALLACVLAAGILGAVLLARNSRHDPAPRASSPPLVTVSLPAAAADPPAAEAPLPPESPPGTISPGKAGDFVGKSVTVEYTVATVGDSTRTDTVFLNSTARAGKGVFAAVIFKSDRLAFEKAFGEDLEAAFKGKRIRVTGEVRSYRDSPEIVLEEPGQVQVVR